MMGGFKATEPAGSDEQGILDVVKDAVETSLGKTFTIFQAVEYTTQVVIIYALVLVLNKFQNTLNGFKGGWC